MATDTLVQGVTFAITAADIRDADNALIDVRTGWSVLAKARADSPRGAEIAAWSTTPTGTQGAITLGVGTVVLQGTPDMTAPWTAARVVIQAKLIEQAGARKARIINVTYDVSHDAVV